MLVELIEDKEKSKKSDPAELENLARGYSKFYPFSTNHPKFSDDCLCRKCKWDPKYRSKRILESEFIEILGVPKEKPSSKRYSSSDSLLDKKLKKSFEMDPPLTEPPISELSSNKDLKVDEEIIILPNKAFL